LFVIFLFTASPYPGTAAEKEYFSLPLIRTVVNFAFAITEISEQGGSKYFTPSCPPYHLNLVSGEFHTRYYAVHFL
jgi:hypothetical protein